MGSTNHNPDKVMQYQKIIRTKANKLKKNNSIYTKKKEIDRPGASGGRKAAIFCSVHETDSV